MVALEPVVQAYAWGSRTALPELCGTASPSPHPVAEHWFGAHDSGSSLCADGRALDARIADDPERELGARVLAEHGGGLPFLVKLLSAEQALSLQAHPSPEKAREGYAAEDARGIAVDAADRNYRDANHKPEILVALTEFHALVGFRPVERTIALLDAFDVDSLRPYRDMLAGQPDAEGLRAVFTTFVTMPHVVLADVVSDLVTRAVSYLTVNGVDGPWSAVATTVAELAERYPTDPGVLGVLLLNRVVLQPGQAVYLGPGQLHAYLRGVGVEVMANSDNVLRGGLTPKHVDVPELMRVLEFGPLADPTVDAVPADRGIPGEVDYPTPEPDFALSRIDLPADRPVTWRPDGPEVLLCTSGEARVDEDGVGEVLRPGRAVWVPASARRVCLHGLDGATVFRTRVGGR
ncbi:mannose-6-phosphate isomerase, class I [Dietzia cinnamea]|uniref:mannose-6-phosphate isomerase, class I n=2 Tax=Dietzia TaxID=37914 RepID=UPI00031DB9EF|nr:mannose-6-phosphate isomerase, class I [Dietzia cinnamea]MCT2263763.1 mannose-6-phosphate isomerase, class I [Dietzia cinnamea]OAH41190.1 mannose-6-phosphate isomerase [Dietzia cinnamea]